MTANILINNYYYRYKQLRKNCKNLIDINNIAQAKTNLQNLIAEHESKYPNAHVLKDFNFEERQIMKHALEHLNVFQNTNQSQQKQATSEILNEQMTLVTPE